MDPRFLDHFQNPRHVGELTDPDARVEVENPVCGDQLTLCLGLTGDVVAAIAYRVRGCSGAVAAASVMSELALGQPVSQARTLDTDTISQALGGLPALKRHGADLAADGLRKALAKAGA
jgi:nitrogen fixation NifU-like protein